jgi:nucleotide-binding universal stress UspA family protein
MAAPLQQQPGLNDAVVPTEQLVLIAVDGSDQAVDAFNFYVTHIHQPDNKVLIFHGAEIPPQPTNEATVMCSSAMWDEMMEEQRKMTKLLEHKFADLMHAHNMAGRFQAILCARPGELIVEVAEKEHCTMIIIGSRGLGKLRRTIMGSVSHYVLHHAHCPVVICTHNENHSHHSKHKQQQQQQPEQHA